MIVTFLGHSDFRDNEICRQKLLNLFCEYINDQEADMYLGGYGCFDSFAYSCCNDYKKINSGIKLWLITPYLNSKKFECDRRLYDGFLYPELEKIPQKFAITYRNRWMVDSADIIFAYITREWGGAYTSYKYALSKGKRLINLYCG